MNAGEPPDEEGDDEVEERSTDPSGDTASDGTDGDSPEDATADGDDGTDGDGLDPAQEVEAAVEDVMGPGALDDGGDEGEDESESEDEMDGGESASTDDDPSSDAVADASTGTGASAGSGRTGETPSGGVAGVDGDVNGDDADVDADDVDADGDDADVDADDADADGDDADAGAEGENGDEDAEDVASDDGDDADSVPGDGDSFRRDEPLSVDDDPADDDGVDESAAVQAAQELVESEQAGETADGREAADAADGAESSAVGDAEASADAADETAEAQDADGVEEPAEDVPADVRKYDRFKKIDGGTYDRANEFLRDRTYITAREWAMARLCADFRTETGVEMTKIGENLPELVPFMTDTYTPQAVNQARAAFEEKVRKAGATFLYGAMCDFFTAEELDDVMYEATEVAKFLLEVEGVELSVEEELAAEDHISEVMRDVREHSAALRHDEVTCPECGHEIGGGD